MNHIETLRNSIDEIDQQIIKLLAKRMEHAKSIGMLKKAQGISLVDKSRWMEVLSDRLSLARQQGLSEELVEKLWNMIHEYALEIEKRV